MFNVTTKSMQWGEETLTLETGKVARQADGSVIATLGETSVMANVTFARSQKPGQDFFPLNIVGQNGAHHQHFVFKAGHEQRADRTVDQTRGQCFLLGRTRLALEEPTGDLAG